jgi:CHASE2 domain-containing sensor protein
MAPTARGTNGMKVKWSRMLRWPEQMARYLHGHRMQYRDAVLISVVSICLYGMLAGFAALLGKGLAHLLEPQSNLNQDLDLYDFLFYERKQTFGPVDSSIVIIDAYGNSRTELADAIELFERMGPKVFGFDLWIDPARQQDPLGTRRLLRSFEENDNVVAIYRFDPTRKELIPDYGQLSGSKHTDRLGFSMIQESDPTATARIAQLWVPASKGDTLYSFTAQIIRSISPVAFREICQGGTEERINFRRSIEGPSFDSFTLNELLTLPAPKLRSLLEGRLVLIGHLDGGGGDILRTPLNPDPFGTDLPDMPGVVVHAHILSTFLQDRQITEFNKLSTLPFTFLICFVVGLLFIVLHRHSVKLYTVIKVPIFMLTSGVVIFFAMVLLERNIMFSLLSVMMPIWLIGEAREFVHDVRERRTRVA